MKNLFTLLALLAICAGRGQAQTFTGAYNGDSCNYHYFFYDFNAPGPAALCTLEQSFGNGVVNNYSLTLGQNNPWYFGLDYNYPAPGAYTSKAVLIKNGVRLDSVIQNVAAGSCQVFSGRIFADLNGNCAFNAGADSNVYVPVHIKIDSANIPVDTIWACGLWMYQKHSTGGASATYKFTILDMPAIYSSTCQPSNSVTVSASPGGVYSSVNFGYTCMGSGFDLSGWFTALMRTTTAGFSWIYPYFTNPGCAPQAGTVTLKVSPKYSITTAGINPAPVSVSNNLITWNYSGLHLGDVRGFTVPIVPTAIYSVGDTGCNTLTINPLAGDPTPADNVISRCDSLRTAFDPNDKAVLPTGNITSGSRLTYLINFENLGNDTAFNVHVLDTLSSTLDASSFQLISASHPMRVLELTGAGGVRILKFDFPDIRLADKTKPLHNKGFVRFSIKTKTGLAAGTNIPNRAGIYFDFNPVVMTNTASNKIGTQQSVQVLEAASVNTIYPNPTTDHLTIANADGKLTHAVMTTVTGQVVRRWNLVAGENNVSLEAFPAGLYLVHLHGAAGIQVEKLEKR